MNKIIHFDNRCWHSFRNAPCCRTVQASKEKRKRRKTAFCSVVVDFVGTLLLFLTSPPPSPTLSSLAQPARTIMPSQTQLKVVLETGDLYTVQQDVTTGMVRDLCVCCVCFVCVLCVFCESLCFFDCSRFALDVCRSC